MDEEQQIRFVANVLMKIPIFSRLTVSEKQKLATKMKVKEFRRGDTIIKAGEQMQWFGVICQGKALNVQTKEAIRSGECLCQEILVNHGEKSEFTIKCSFKMTVFVISIKEIEELFGNRFQWKNKLLRPEKEEEQEQKDESKRTRRRRDAKAETFTALSASQQISRAQTSVIKSAKLSKWLQSQLKKNVLFHGLGEDLLRAIVENLYCTDVNSGQVLMKQKEIGDCMYIIERGSLDVYIDGIVVSRMNGGDCVGELSLMYDSPRAATCKTVTNCKLWCIDRNDFKITLRREAQKELHRLVVFLQKVPILQLLSDEETRKIAESMNIVSFDKDELIIQEDEKCDDEQKSNFYIIQKGEAIAIKKIDGQDKTVKKYKQNDYFGERALITNEARAATIKVVSNDGVQCLALSRSEFNRTMGSLKALIKQRMSNYEKAVEQARTSSLKPGATFSRMFRRSFTRDKKKKESTKSKMVRKFSDFHSIKGLGQGSFATVWLVRDKKSKQTYALKRMSKAGIEDTQQQTHVQHEVTILKSLDCDFVSKLWCTFQDENFVYMLLDIGLGGDMFTYLECEGKLTEKNAKFFFGCVALAFEHLHSKQIVFRDLKPENLIFDFRGYLKLCDFGFAKKLCEQTSNQRTFTVCGTPVYLAPEVIVGKGHSFAVDWWTSGIFIYEMITGYPPFDEPHLVDTYDAILHKKQRYKASLFGKDLQNLLNGLLHKKPNQRFGNSMVDIEARIKQHPWLKGFDFDQLSRGELASPFRPKLSNDQDTRYFDQDIERRKNEKVEKCKEPHAEWLKHF